ncbi:hydroxyisourate hydrolase [Nonomuraea sp. NBC_01738]|uniref:hydroxyisourate hydrolase n=1 Tax=Nonomuraea sp. NBC_01738 TaxID=2976003 RepID=UPI002E10B430|nr:hydroxyisourate hydrolase [Nonomuraea sp. NBC_01738]
MSITAQALDGVYGRSAAGVKARLERAQDGAWTGLASSETDTNGFVCEWVDLPLDRGLYRIVFESDQYFVSLGVIAAYPEITVMFRMQDESDVCRVQVLLAPHSYSTYFGTAG